MTPMAQTSLGGRASAGGKMEKGEDGERRGLHGLAVASLLEDFRRHVPRRPARRREDVEGFLVHDPAQAKVGNEEICVVFGCSEQQVLGFQVAMDDAVVVEVCDGRECCADQVCCVRLVIAAFAADAVEKLAAES